MDSLPYPLRESVAGAINVGLFSKVLCSTGLPGTAHLRALAGFDIIIIIMRTMIKTGF
jgi:hypothetical protein